MGVGDVVKIRRVDTYHVEINHPDPAGWHHIHPADWETTQEIETARAYADEVGADFPTSNVRIVQTERVEVTDLRTGVSRILPTATTSTRAT
jgi:hypothetical protein